MTVTCPNADVLRGVLDSSLPEPVQAEVVSHLDGCSTCQAKLEQFAAGGSSILVAARLAHADTKPEVTSAFWPAYQRVEREIQTPADAMALTRAEFKAEVEPPPSFDFLEPSDEPEKYLGWIDRFHVEELIGRGGMGLVFRSQDACLERMVAVKVLDPQYAKNQLARDRFIREARAAAKVAHENVVTIHHVGCLEDKGLSFMVMQFVRGKSLQERLDAGGPLPVREAVRIAAATASGLAAAHETGLIHRDVKPGNILIERPSGRVLLTDFGLARLTEDVKLTQTGFVAGTPLYMSPEQARGETVDHRSDLFSLGSVLYAMLSGAPPFPGTSPFGVLKQVTDARPRAVQDRNPSVPNSLAEVLDRLMEKDPRDRFETASEAAAVLTAELAKLPPETPTTIPARRTSRSVPRYVRSWWRRNGLPVLGGVAAVLALFMLSEATRVTHWTILGQRGQPVAERIVEVAGPGVAEPDTPTKYTIASGEGAVWAVAFDPCGELIASATEGGAVKFWDAHDGHVRGILDSRKSKSPIWAIAFNPDGTRLVTASDDGFVRLWDVKSKLEIKSFKHDFPARTAAMSPDGKTLASGTRDGKVLIWDIETGTSKETMGHEGGVVLAITFSPDGQLIASSGSDQTVRLWETETANAHTTLSKHNGPVYAVAFSPDSQTLASAGWDHVVRIWDVNTGDLKRGFDFQKEDIWSLAFCPFGRHLLTGGQDRLVRWIDVTNGNVVKTYRGHGGPVHTVAVSKDGMMVAAGGRDGTVRVWDVEP